MVKPVPQGPGMLIGTFSSFRSKESEMEFHTFKTTSDLVARYDNLSKENAQKLVNLMVLQVRDTYPVDNPTVKMTTMQYASETLWEFCRRPYYKVWPTVIPYLTRIPLDFPGKMIKVPSVDSICFRLPTERNPLKPIRSALCSKLPVEGAKDRSGLIVHIDTGELTDVGDGRMTPVHSFISFPLNDEPLEQFISNMGFIDCGLSRPDFERGVLREMLKLIVACFLVASGDDDNIINPDVLGRDDARFRTTFEKEVKNVIVDRAFRRRGPGWDIGRKYEQGMGGSAVCYIVPPHPQRYWVGKGRTQVIVKTRKGYVCGKDSIVKVPTGYEKE